MCYNENKMKKYIETVLSSVLLGTSVLLGLSFWLNIRFGFNLFYAHHWEELAKLQASHTPVNNIFYVSIGVATFILVFGWYLIFKPKFRKIPKINQSKLTQSNIVPKQISIKQDAAPLTTTKNTNLTRPPKLNLPKNMASIVEQQHKNLQQQTIISKTKSESNNVTVYDAQLSKIFTDNSYLVKPNIHVNGFTTNLFAIGKDEVLWIGAVDCDINIFRKLIEKLNSVFTQTLEDIPINMYPFILDTHKLYDTDENIMIFHDLEDLKNTVSQNPNKGDSDTNQENFDAYSDYIDTIIQYIKNI